MDHSVLLVYGGTCMICILHLCSHSVYYKGNSTNTNYKTETAAADRSVIAGKSKYCNIQQYFVLRNRQRRREPETCVYSWYGLIIARTCTAMLHNKRRGINCARVNVNLEYTAVSCIHAYGPADMSQCSESSRLWPRYI